MANKYSPNITFTETQVSGQEPPITEGMISGGIINSDYGYGKVVQDLYSVQDLLDFAGKPNEYNYQNWFNIRDYLISNKQFKAVRPIPTNAKNASIKLRGVSKLKTNAWYSGSDVRALEKPIKPFYNKDVAENSLENSFTTNSKIQVLNRYVTAKQNLSVAICSNADHYEQSIFNEEMEVLRSFNASQAPDNPVNDERYTISRTSLEIESITGASEEIVVDGDLTNVISASDELRIDNIANATKVYTNTSATSSIVAATKTIVFEGQDLTDFLRSGDTFVLANTTSNDGTYTIDTISFSTDTTIVVIETVVDETLSTTTETITANVNIISVASITYSSGTGKSTITANEDLETSTAQGTISYLKGDWSTEGTFKSGDVVEYDLSNTQWNVVNISINKKYFVELEGKVYKWNGSTWEIQLGDDYKPVDLNGDSKAEYAVKNIFGSTLLNSNGSVKSFKDIFKDNLDFSETYDENNVLLKDYVLVFVLVKDENTNLWEYAESHLGSYIATSRDDNNDPFYIEKVVFDDSNYVYAKVGEESSYTAAITANQQYTNSSATSSAVAATKTFTFIGQDLTPYLRAGKQITLASTTSNNGTFTVSSFNLSGSDTVIVVDETVVDETLSTTTETVDVSKNEIIVASENLQDFQIGEKLKYSGLQYDASDVDPGLFTITNITYSGGNTTIEVFEDLLRYTVGTTPLVYNTYAGKVSTNMNVYGNPREPEYDISNANASEGFSVANMLIYDMTPQNSAGTTITDYSNLANADLLTSAEVFLDKDNVDVDILLPFEITDEFGNKHIDKMSEIAEERQDCWVPVCPFDQSLFLGNSDSDVTVENIVNEFGNQRANLFSGTFTKFGKFSSTFCSMKYYEDTYNNKFRWLTYAGDIARMVALQDINPIKGVWVPIAGIPDGEMNNAIEPIFIPNEAQREELNKNGVNTLFKNPRLTYPVLWSNINSYRVNNLFRVQSYRLMLNKIENFIKDNLIPQMFKFKNDQTYKRIRDIIEPFLNNIVASGGLVSAELEFPYVPNEPSNTLSMIIRLVPTGILENFNVAIEMTEQGLEITEDVVQ